MTDSELLGVLVEFSIGLGGFSAITAAFIHQNQAMGREDVYRVLNLLMMALGPAFIALAALGILKVTASIQYANGLLLIFIVCAVLQAILGRRSLTVDEQEVLIPRVIFVMQAAFFLNAGIQLLASLGLFESPFIALYAGLVVILLQAVVQFIRLIVARPGGSGS